jgi:hypothetical protein
MAKLQASEYHFLLSFKVSTSFIANDGCTKAEQLQKRLKQPPMPSWESEQYALSYFKGILKLTSKTKAEKRDEAMAQVSGEFSRLMAELEASDAVEVDLALMVDRLGKVIEWRM